MYDPILCMNIPDTTKDSKVVDSVKEYEFHYTVPNDKRTMVGSGRGATEEEAKADFMKTHKTENPTITMSKLYKTIDKAIQMCDSNPTQRYINAIKSENKTVAKQFVRQAEQDEDVPESDLQKIYKAFKERFGKLD